ncbi:TPA: hypothetical protein JBA32_03870 [Legionella pneumophila]|nr:hypothetical protein [Legionella pneumophila]HAT1987399.1 hypothetical protein [Legionella pneumophila]HAT8744562.1 hypothetical protein [Legionella pneumophila]
MNNKECCVISNSARKNSWISYLLKKYKNPTCQFKDYSHQLYECNNEYFCELHLPLESEKKKVIQFGEILNNILNGQNRDFNYINLSNVDIDFNKYKEQLNGRIMFRGATLAGVNISNLSKNYILFEGCLFQNSFCLSNLNYVDVDLNTIVIYSDIENHHPGLFGVFTKGFEVKNTKNINLSVNNSTFRTKIMIYDNCKLSNVKFENSIIGWNDQFEINFENKFNIGKVIIHTLMIKQCDIYLQLDVVYPEKITNFDLEDAIFFQAPFFRGETLYRGQKYFPLDKNFNIDLLGEHHKEPHKFYYAEALKYRALYSLSIKYNLQEDEKTFFSLIQRCLEKTNKVDRTHKIISKIYHLTSNYGTSIKLPLVWIAFFILFPSIIYYSDPSIQKNAFELSIISMVKPLSFELYSSDSYWLSRAINIFQNIIAPPLWTFFILSFRWNFKKITSS